jgi:ABC-type protease/lipase transport system fused ATPase/permease subunit
MVTHRANVLACVDKMLLLKDGRQHLFGSKASVLHTLSGHATLAQSSTEDVTT